ncbi:MAG TPA: zinc-dependent alcohol dehydrogenase family protein [Propionibacteriaceae bacterium]|nr:zinc-dependent alcohol dehydrogenase family protein [Propionibacteriaceae bacterium]
MRTTVISGPGEIQSVEVDEPQIHRPSDVVVRVVASCICGSDLWPYRGVQETKETHPIGHEFVGVVEEVGDDVTTLRPGQFVIAPFVVSDGSCVNCRNGFQTSCLHGASWGATDEHGLEVHGGQSARVRVPLADGTLVATEELPDEELIASLLALSDVMSTGHHAAVSAGVGPGRTVAVVGDGAVGLCAVLASKRLGAERIVLFSRHASRQALGREFGADTVLEERGDAGVRAVHELFDGVGPDCVLECVGTAESMDQALRSVRPGGFVGYVGVPSGGAELPIRTMFDGNINVAGGVAPARTYIPELLPDVLSGAINPGRVFDLTLPLADVAEGYVAMDERRAIKVLLKP